MAKSASPKTKISIFFRMDADRRLYISLAVALITLVTAYFSKNFTTPGLILITWTAFALCVIIFDWLAILNAHPRQISHVARLEDSSRFMIFVFVVVASIVSIVAIYLLLRSAKGQANVDQNVLLAMGAVIISWWLVHTVFTMRYAHLYYGSTDIDGSARKPGGLEFPGDEKEPDFMDFVYFSFVLGMTFQVSDVEISSRRIRRLAWGHGLISFAFNTSIVALGINLISGLVSK